MTTNDRSMKKIYYGIFVNRNGDVVPLPMYSGGENRVRPPTRKILSADEIK